MTPDEQAALLRLAKKATVLCDNTQHGSSVWRKQYNELKKAAEEWKALNPVQP